ncbi:MAG: hypothetical protein IPK83_00565 [Planctomycetes bacterium]|nr:hypothetical protein [Planctomycetota bacterium]
MKNDPIVEEIHRIREEISERFHGDLHSICEDARVRLQKSGRKTISLPPRRVEDEIHTPRSKKVG